MITVDEQETRELTGQLLHVIGRIESGQQYATALAALNSAVAFIVACFAEDDNHGADTIVNLGSALMGVYRANRAQRPGSTVGRTQ